MATHSKASNASHGGLRIITSPLWHQVSRSRRRVCVHSALTGDTVKRFELPTRSVQAAVKLEPGVSGRDQVVRISSVSTNSEAWQAGLRPGQRLVGISDPNFATQVWTLDGNSSFRFVKVAMRMRIGSTIILDVETRSDDVSLDAAQQSSSNPAEPATADSTDTDSYDMDNEARNSSSQIKSTSVNALDALLSSDDNSEASKAQGKKMTIGEKLARDQRQNESQQSRVQERISKRREVLSQVGGRNDSKTFALVGLFVLVPPIAILLWAASSGLLDRLAANAY